MRKTHDCRVGSPEHDQKEKYMQVDWRPSQHASLEASPQIASRFVSVRRHQAVKHAPGVLAKQVAAMFGHGQIATTVTVLAQCKTHHITANLRFKQFQRARHTESGRLLSSRLPRCIDCPPGRNEKRAPRNRQLRGAAHTSKHYLIKKIGLVLVAI